jgi:hypothetical protein
MKKPAVRRLTWLGTPLALSLATSCAMDFDGGRTEQGLTSVAGADFEDYAVGSLTSPWTLTPSASASQMGIENTSDHGNVLLLQGSTGYGDYRIGKLGGFSISSDVVASTDINPESGASFVWSLHGQGSGPYARRIRLERAPGSTTLVASSLPTGTVDCGSLDSDTWSNIALVVRAEQTPHTFDLLINGQPTACTGLEVVTDPPFTSVQLMDASNLNWGGNVRLDNVAVSTP